MNTQKSMPQVRRTALAIAISVAFLDPAIAAAPGAPIGPLVTVAPGTSSAVASNAAGEYVVVWLGPTTSSASPGSVLAQRYTAASVAIGQSFVVSSGSGTGSRKRARQANPRIAMDAEGDFEVSWVESNDSGLGVANPAVYVRRFAAGGTASGNDVMVGNGESADVAMDPDGDAIVVWNSVMTTSVFNGYGFTTTSARSVIHARRLDVTGATVGQAIQVDTRFSAGLGRTGGLHFFEHPAVSLDPAGEFTAVWGDRHSYIPRGAGSYVSTHSINARRFGADNKPLTGVLQINDPAEFESFSDGTPAVANDASGNFTVTWSSAASRNYSNRTGYAQAFHADGTPRSPSIVVNTSTNADGGSETIGPVVMDDAGDFTVASLVYFSANDTRSGATRLRSFTPEGVLRGGPATILARPSVGRSLGLARDAAGNLAFVQSDFSFVDFSQNIIAQRFGGF